MRGAPKRIKGERGRRAKSFIFQFEQKEILICATVFADKFGSLQCRLIVSVTVGLFRYWIVEQRYGVFVSLHYISQNFNVSAVFVMIRLGLYHGRLI